MRASIGGIVNLFMIAVFIVIISSFLLFNVSYAKSYRVKNKIIETYEQYEGNCKSQNSSCYKAIKEYEDRLGYNLKTKISSTADGQEYCVDDLGYCALEIKEDYNAPNAYTYRIRTEISVRFPLIENIMGIGKFKIVGLTKTIYKT